MNIIAIETSSRHATLAALVGDTGQARLLRHSDLGGDRRTAQALAPALRDLLGDVGWPPQSVGLIAVAVGPGSFTGLRIGVTTAKTLAYAVGGEVVSVNTLVALAAQAPPPAGPLWAILDAQRQELFAARFENGSAEAGATHCDTSIVSQEVWLGGLQPGECVTGAPLGRLAQRLPASVCAVAKEYWQPMAAAVGEVAWRAYQAGHRQDLWKLAPQYYRPSYAEEKAARAK
jgi:tRNA threonylcarbamoyladenosine biosynthesis protein TsaB